MKIIQSLLRACADLLQPRAIVTALGCTLLVLQAQAASKCWIIVETTPTDAQVEVVVKPAKMGVTPAPVKAEGHKFEIRANKDDSIQITANARNFESLTNTVGFNEVKAGVNSETKPYAVRMTLEALRSEIPVDLVSEPGTKFYVADSIQEPATTLVFARGKSSDPWPTVTVRAERPLYKTAERSYLREELVALAAQGKRPQLAITLDEIERRARLMVVANEVGARVLLDGRCVTNTPGEVALVFSRAGADEPWPSHLLRIEKEEYEYRPVGTFGQPAYETNLTFEAVRALNQRLNLPDFQPVRFFEVPMYRVAVSRGEAKLELTNSISAKDPNEPSATRLLAFGGNPKNEPMIVGRIGAVLPLNAQGNRGDQQGKPGEIILALPIIGARPTNQPPEIIGSQIYLLTASGSSIPVTDQEPGIYDLDPCITKDRKTVFYSSNKGGQRGIWKKPLIGQGKSQIDPGRGIDVEPAVFTTSEGVARIAFTRYSPSAAVGTRGSIIIQEEDRSLFAETKPGRSPAWSNDGTKIAYVSPENKICVMDLSTGESPRVLTKGTSVDEAPIWLPGDRYLIYASASAAEARYGTGNFDLWKVDMEGNTEQIVSNTSYDGMPAMTSETLVGEGKQGTKTYTYFLSNRGAQKTGADIWKIHYFELELR